MGALHYLETVGTALNECLPYSSDNGIVVGCSQQCSTIQDMAMLRYKCAADTSKELNGMVEIATEIFRGGPVVGTMQIYADIFNY